MNINNFYSGSQIYNNNIYVHLHAENIGRAGGGDPQTGSELVKYFQQAKNIAFQASKKHYKSLFLESLSEPSQKILDEIFSDEDNFQRIQNELAKSVESALAIDKMEKLMNITQQNSSSLLKKVLNSGNARERINSFNILMKRIIDASKLLDTSNGSVLAAILSEKLQQGQLNTGGQLVKAINKFKQDRSNNKKLLSQRELDQANQLITTINAFGSALKTGFTKGGEKIKIESLNIMFNAIFNTGFAEAVSAQLGEKAYQILGKTVKSTLTGTKTTNIELRNISGEIVERIGQQSAGKADIKLENVETHLQSLSDSLNITIGISDKFYKREKFNKLHQKVRGRYSSGSGGTLEEALYSSFPAGRGIYLAYNTIGHGADPGYEEAQKALHEVILTRQIVRLFSSRGGQQDFAQFMYVNGRIVPIYQIILSTLQSIKNSESQAGSQNQPLSLSIENRKQIQDQTHQPEKENSKRISDIGKAFRNAKIKAHVNFNNLNYI